MPFKRSREDSDSDNNYAPSTSVRRAAKRQKVEVFDETSSAPGSPAATHVQALEAEPQMGEQPHGNSEDVMEPPLAPFHLISPGLLPPQTPRKARAQSVEPAASSPMSILHDSSPNMGGRPKHTPKTRTLSRNIRDLKYMQSQITPDRHRFAEVSEEMAQKKAEADAIKLALVKEELAQRKAASSAKRAAAAAEKKAEEARKKAAALEVERRKQDEVAEKARIAHEDDLARRAQDVLKLVTSNEKGGFNFKNMEEFFRSAFGPGGDPQASANMTRMVKAHGASLAELMLGRSSDAEDEFVTRKMREKLAEEGKAIQALLSRDEETTVTKLLETFSMERISLMLEEAAPTLWTALAEIATNDATNSGETRREKRLVFTTICAMISVLRSQKANNYQVVIGLFLLGSGASKREMEVLAHAGLSISYTAITQHVKKLSEEGMAQIRALIKKSMCSIVWDNLNIAFRVDAQRLDSANHFDNGTTATLIPLFDPTTGKRVPHGTLPFSMKPPRTTCLPIFEWSPEDVLPTPESAKQLSQSCLWHVKQMAFEHIEGLAHLKKDFEACPEVLSIPVHKSEQYPLPAMHEDESSIEGSIRVYTTIIEKHLQMTDEDLEKHGLMFDDGDLLTDLLKDKIESARRNSTEAIGGMRASVRRFGVFHAKMAGCRLTINEHWGTPNSPCTGSLWWEHTKLLKRKPMMAGWKNKKATPWKPGHELLLISVPAHVKDGFRIHCGQPDVEQWASAATSAEFDVVSQRVFDSLFSTAALNELRKKTVRDITLENIILYNRDALFYIVLVHAIKKGDIGSVMNVFRVWTIMMRSSKTMPKYADAIFETLGRIKNFPPKLRELFLHNWLVNLTGRANGFKEIDLLQEHQNFWAKIIYTAKGSNKSWSWLSMITVCIFHLRDAMRTVQKAYNIPAYGEKHKTPPITEEVALLARALEKERLQTYVSDRPGHERVLPVRDLIQEGALYLNTPKAFYKFREDPRIPKNLGVVSDDFVAEGGGSEDDEQSENEEERYNPTEDDLAADDEEFYHMADTFIEQAAMMVDEQL